MIGILFRSEGQGSAPSEPLCPLCSKFCDFLPEPVQLFFMGAQFFRAVFTLQIIVCIFRKTFRETEEGDFPPEEQDDGSGKKGPRIELSYKEEGREHHGYYRSAQEIGQGALHDGLPTERQTGRFGN